MGQFSELLYYWQMQQTITQQPKKKKTTTKIYKKVKNVNYIFFFGCCYCRCFSGI